MRFVISLAVLLLPALALAQSHDVQVEQVWSRAAPAGATGVVYLTVRDHGGPDSLTGATTPVASKAELHETTNDDGVTKMRSVAAAPVSSDKPLVLGPGGYHLMLVGLKQRLVAGSSFPVTLHFANAGEITVEAKVEKAGASMPAMDHGSMNMPMHSGAK